MDKESICQIKIWSKCFKPNNLFSLTGEVVYLLLSIHINPDSSIEEGSLIKTIQTDGPQIVISSTKGSLLEVIIQPRWIMHEERVLKVNTPILSALTFLVMVNIKNLHYP